jgi:aspartyl-tRNA(Asn)/glutamyl-tRNA(Gln) amidotransferase subunit C
MPDIDENELDKLAKLSRIEMTPEEKKKLLQNLSKILSYIELLSELDTEGVAPCNHIIETLHSVMREDEIGELLPRDVFLANSPSHVGGMIRVPPVIKFNNP